MSLKLTPLQPVPDETARVARAAFPKGNPYLTLRDRLGTIFADDEFADLFPGCGQPREPPWRLALVTIRQFREPLADRQAAEAVRARIAWKYLRGLDLTDPGFDFSVLSACRARLLTGSAEDRLLEKVLEWCRTQGLVKARGRQRTDSTHVWASIHVLSHRELAAETLRAAFSELATVAPAWLRALAPLEWFDRYTRRIEDTRLPQEKAAREVYKQNLHSSRQNNRPSTQIDWVFLSLGSKSFRLKFSRCCLLFPEKIRGGKEQGLAKAALLSLPLLTPFSCGTTLSLA